LKENLFNKFHQAIQFELNINAFAGVRIEKLSIKPQDFVGDSWFDL